MSRDRRGIPKKQWARIRRQVLERDGYRCVECGRPGRLEVDHIVRVADGGDSLDLDNLQTLDRKCHIVKTMKENRRHDPARDEWRQLLVSRLVE